VRIDFYPKTVKFTWSLCIMCACASSTLGLAATYTFFKPLPVWLPMLGMLLCGFFGVECARQSYVLQRSWPARSMLFLWPFALFSLFNSPIFAIGAGLSVFNLILWFFAYKLTRRLVLLSPRAGVVPQHVA
jgi:hypothetical protein